MEGEPQSLRARFSRATLRVLRAEEALNSTLLELGRHEQRVWTALREVREGRTEMTLAYGLLRQETRNLEQQPHLAQRVSGDAVLDEAAVRIAVPGALEDAVAAQPAEPGRSRR